MKILHYSSGALSTPFGTPSAVRDWCDALAEEGADVTLVSDEASPIVRSPRSARSVRIPHRFAHAVGGGVRFPRGLGPLFEDRDLVVLHGGWRVANVRAAAVARSVGVPYVLTPHGRYDPHIYARHRRRRMVSWWALERPMVERAVAVHMFFEDEPTIVPADVPTVIAPNGIDPPQSVTWDGGSNGSLMWLGRFDPEHKGLDLLIESIHSLPPESRPTIDLYGHDWLGGRELVVRQIHRRGVEGWVHTRDPILGPDKWKALSATKGFVYPSRWEAFGLAVAEAASIGVPSVVTSFPLGRFLAQQGAATLSDGSPGDLAQKLVELAGSQTTTPTNGVDVMRTHFSWEAVARSWLDQIATKRRASELRRSP